ncbi:hypothetical protein CYY_010330, partial [Polysphondylium violaceum]
MGTQLIVLLDAVINLGSDNIGLRLSDVVMNQYLFPIEVFTCVAAPLLSLVYLSPNSTLTITNQDTYFYFRIVGYNRDSELTCSIQTLAAPFNCKLSQSKKDLSIFRLDMTLDIMLQSFSSDIQVHIGTTGSSNYMNLFFNSEIIVPTISLISFLVVPMMPSTFNIRQPIINGMTKIYGSTKTMPVGPISTQNSFYTLQPVMGSYVYATYLSKYYTFGKSTDVSPVPLLAYQGTDTPIILVENQIILENLDLISGFTAETENSNHMTFFTTKFYVSTYENLRLDVAIGGFRENDIRYPYGYFSGTYKQFTFGAVDATTPYYSIQLNITMTSYSQSFFWPIPVYTPDPLFVDSNPPTIVEWMAIKLDGTNNLIRVHIKDDISGFSALSFGDYPIVHFILAKDLVEGDLLDGIYEVVIDTMFSSVSQISLNDAASNLVTFLDGYPLNPQGTKPYLLQDDLSPSTITTFYFEKDIVDVSVVGQNNTLYLNYTGAGPNSKIFFDAGLLNYDSHELYKSYLQDPSFYYSWNKKLKLFKIDFFIPHLSFPTDPVYSFGVVELFNKHHLSSTLGRNAVYTVVSSEDSNQLPPIVSLFQVSHSLYTIPSTSDWIDVVWNFTLQNFGRLTRASDSYIQISSDLDPVGYRISTLSSNTGSSFFTFTLTIYGNKCVPQTYVISSAYFEDEYGRKSGYNRDSTINAFMNFNLPEYAVKINCPIQPDTTPPILVSLDPTFPASPYSSFSLDRKITFLMTTQDNVGLSRKHFPTIYLSQLLDSKMSTIKQRDDIRFACQTIEFQYSTTEIIYTVDCDVPYGYGYPNGLLISVYGITDIHMNLKGYDTLSLKGMGFPYFIGPSIISFDPHLVSSNNFNGNGELILNGYHLSYYEPLVEVGENATVFSKITPRFKYHTSLQLSFNFKSDVSFYIRIKNGQSSEYSNILFIVPIISLDSSSSSSSSSSTKEI